MGRHKGDGIGAITEWQFRAEGGSEGMRGGGQEGTLSEWGDKMTKGEERNWGQTHGKYHWSGEL